MSELRIRRVLPSAPEHVWCALTDPRALEAWFWPRDTYGTVAEVDPRPGGRYRIDAPRLGIAAAGEYVTVERPRLLVMSWRWCDEPAETLVTITLDEIADGTVLTLIHERFADDQDRDRHAQGWSDCLDRLPDWLTSATEPV
jgi:uncharacterized protein YndB with AHSA1/START domain